MAVAVAIICRPYGMSVWYASPPHYVLNEILLPLSIYFAVLSAAPHKKLKLSPSDFSL